MEYRARAHNIRKSAASVDEFIAALDAEGIPYDIKRDRINIGGDEHQIRIDVRVPYAGGWESCTPYHISD